VPLGSLGSKIFFGTPALGSPGSKIYLGTPGVPSVKNIFCFPLDPLGKKYLERQTFTLLIVHQKYLTLRLQKLNKLITSISDC
jgi:hypothetical protein